MLPAEYDAALLTMISERFVELNHTFIRRYAVNNSIVSSVLSVHGTL
jgi:hypothetical protein